ncbi:hypothetical protein HUJ04_011243 [Dendroctonus ponderosae]|nr:hypothetical protein HUJ04_011243 [Dendroctonus ponderosae]
MDDEWVGFLLLAGLLDRYSPMIMAIEHSGIDISADSTKSKLLDMAANHSDGTRTGAYAAKHDSLQKQFKGDNASNDKRKMNDRSHDCQNCKKPGLYMSQCKSYHKSLEKNAFSAVFLSGNYSKENFYLDSGASNHMSPNESWIKNTSPSIISEIIVANKQKLQVKGSGNIEIITQSFGKCHEVSVENVLCVPELSTNLLSVSKRGFLFCTKAALVDALQLRFGNEHKETVFQAQLRMRQQKSGESLQEFEGDIESLTHLSYPSAPETFRKQLAAERFIEGVRGDDMRPRDISEALIRALEFEASRVSVPSAPRVKLASIDNERDILADKLDNIYDALQKMTASCRSTRPPTQEALQRRSIRCFNCGKLRHIRSDCRNRARSSSPSPRKPSGDTNIIRT